MLNVFARAAHAPEMAFRLDPKVFAMVPEPVTQSVERSKPIQNVFNQLLRDLQVPRSVLQFVNYPTRFDSTRDAEAARQGQDPRAARSRTTPGACGTTGSATSIPTSRSTAA